MSILHCCSPQPFVFNYIPHVFVGMAFRAISGQAVKAYLMTMTTDKFSNQLRGMKWREIGNKSDGRHAPFQNLFKRFNILCPVDVFSVTWKLNYRLAVAIESLLNRQCFPVMCTVALQPRHQGTRGIASMLTEFESGFVLDIDISVDNLRKYLNFLKFVVETVRPPQDPARPEHGWDLYSIYSSFRFSNQWFRSS